MDDFLLSHVRRYVALSSSEAELLKSSVQYKKITKKTFLLTEGDICQAKYFIISGCLSMYVVTDGGTKQILQFGIEGWWLSDYQSLENKKPSSYYIQAVEDTEVAVFTKVAAETLASQIPALEKYFRIMMQIAYSAALRKIEILLCQSAEERYQYFINAFPGFVQRVPQYMLASFLGFTPEFFSMLRSKGK